MSTSVPSVRLFVRHSLLLRALSERLHDVEHDDAVGRRDGGYGGAEQAPGWLRLELVLRNVLGAEEDEDGGGEHQHGVEKEAPEGVRSAKLHLEQLHGKIERVFTSFPPGDS